MPVKDGLRAGTWECLIADAWLTAATAAGSPRYGLLDDLCAAVETLLHGAIPDAASARAVIDELLATLERCDTLPFDTEEQCLAYICWHLGDRYGRTQQALDALFSRGHLPLRHAEPWLSSRYHLAPGGVRFHHNRRNRSTALSAVRRVD